MRVFAVKGIYVICLSSNVLARMPNFSLAKITILLPSGVSSARDASCAASASSCAFVLSTGMNSDACRFPSVIVPVLSSIRISTSPAASIALPLIAKTFALFSLLIPAIPIAESSAPIVVGARHTSNATSVVMEVGFSIPA